MQIRWWPSSCPCPIYSLHTEVKLSFLIVADSQKTILIDIHSFLNSAYCFYFLLPHRGVNSISQRKEGDPQLVPCTGDSLGCMEFVSTTPHLPPHQPMPASPNDRGILCLALMSVDWQVFFSLPFFAVFLDWSFARYYVQLTGNWNLDVKTTLLHCLKVLLTPSQTQTAELGIGHNLYYLL